MVSHIQDGIVELYPEDEEFIKERLKMVLKPSTKLWDYQMKSVLWMAGMEENVVSAHNLYAYRASQSYWSYAPDTDSA